MTIFDILNNIIRFKSEEEYEKHIALPEFFKTYNSYMIFRWLSMCDKSDIINTLSTYQIELESIKNPELHYKLLLKIIPRHKFCNLRYVK
jgi:hypothetical protein